MKKLRLLLVTLFIMSACSKAPNLNVMDQDTKTEPIYATTECVAGNPDGKRCDKKTCKADKDSDCQEFAKGCLEYGNHYNGTAEGGTCSRVY